jgi:hypothetical protein
VRVVVGNAHLQRGGQPGQGGVEVGEVPQCVSEWRLRPTEVVDMRDWTLARVMWVADRGFSSKENRRELRRGGGHYIIGERLRSGSAEATVALSRQGRYQHVRDNLQVKEVRIADDERFVICFNPEQAERDAALREVMTSKLTALITGSDRLTPTKRAELRGRISTMPGLNRFLRTTPSGLLRIDKTKIAAEANLDGKYLLRCSDPHLSAEDIALGYKQLLQVERGWRDMKTTLELRPVYHRLEDRIRAHVILCGSPCSWSGSSRPAPATPGTTCAKTCRNCTSAPSKARPAPSDNAPSSPPPNATSSPSCASTHPRRSSSWGRPQRPDQHEHHRLDTRQPGRLSPFPQVKPQIPCPGPTSAAEPRHDAERLARELP